MLGIIICSIIAIIMVILFFGSFVTLRIYNIYSSKNIKGYPLDEKEFKKQKEKYSGVGFIFAKIPCLFALHFGDDFEEGGLCCSKCGTCIITNDM